MLAFFRAASTAFCTCSAFVFSIGELRELVSLLRYSSNNLNQLTRRAHETGRIYETDLEDIQQNQERIWTAAEKIVSSLAALK